MAEVMQLRERIKEVKEEADGSTIVSQTTAKEAFEMLSRLWPEAKCRQLAKLLTKGDYPKQSAPSHSAQPRLPDR
jgi:hypothetical protein